MPRQATASEITGILNGLHIEDEGQHDSKGCQPTKTRENPDCEPDKDSNQHYRERGVGKDLDETREQGV